MVSSKYVPPIASPPPTTLCLLPQRLLTWLVEVRVSVKVRIVHRVCPPGLLKSQAAQCSSVTVAVGARRLVRMMLGYMAATSRW